MRSIEATSHNVFSIEFLRLTSTPVDLGLAGGKPAPPYQGLGYCGSIGVKE